MTKRGGNVKQIALHFRRVEKCLKSPKNQSF